VDNFIPKYTFSYIFKVLQGKPQFGIKRSLFCSKKRTKMLWITLKTSMKSMMSQSVANVAYTDTNTDKRYSLL